MIAGAPKFRWDSDTFLPAIDGSILRMGPPSNNAETSPSSAAAMYDGFIIRKVKAEGTTTLRFKYSFENDHHPCTFYLGFEWPTRCKVYAIPRGAAVALD